MKDSSIDDKEKKSVSDIFKSTNKIHSEISANLKAELNNISNMSLNDFKKQQDNVTNDLSDYGKELVLEAMKRSATNGKQYGYVRGILKNWGGKNVKTLHDIEVLDATFKKSNTNSEKEDRSDWTWAEKKAGFREV